MAAAGSWGCGGSSASAGGPTPTPASVPTPTPAPSSLPAGAIGMKVLNTAVPPGGIFQFQLSNTEPKPIGHGTTRPQVPSGPVRGVAVNDPSGLAAGIALVNTSVTPTDIRIQLSSPDAVLGTNIAYPVVTMSMPLSASLTPGATFPIGIDTANTLFADATQNYTTLEFAPGTLTIAGAGSPYVTDVIPGGGLLPDRTKIRVLGSGFTTNTRIAIEDTTVFAPPSPDTIFVSANEIDVIICNGTVAATATTCPNNGTTFQLDGERVRVREGTSILDYYTYLRADDAPGTSGNTLVTEVHPMFSRQTYLTATVPLVNTATQFTGLALQNTSGTDDGIKVELLDAGNASLANFSFILQTGKKIARDVIQDWFGGTVPAGAARVRMTVTSGNQPLQVLGMLGDTSAGTVTPVIPQ